MEVGEDGGAINGSTMEVEGFGLSTTALVLSATVGSGARAEWLILLLVLRDPKHQYRFQQLPHLLFCNY